MSKVTENDLLSEILAALPDAYDPAVHIIADDIARAKGYGRSAAMIILRTKVREGVLREVEVRLPNGKRGIGFVRA